MDARFGREASPDLLGAARPPSRQGAPSRRYGSAGVTRRPALLLAALLAGGLGAASLDLTGASAASAEATSVLEAQQALLAEDEGLEVTPQASVTVAEAQARLQEVAASRAARAEAARPRTVFPIDGARLTSRFGPRWGTTHNGLDLAAPMLTPEYAAADGVVLRAGSASGFGLAVYVLHDNGDVTVYGHMEKILVEAGQYVDAGETIALVGSRGQSTGPHLHFEVYEGGLEGSRVDPMAWLRERGVDVDAAV